jgi:GMP reductase
MKQSLAYSDVYLVPRFSEAKSRSKIDVSVELGGRRFKVPVMPANMVACIDAKRAKWLSENGYFYVYHRFNYGDNRFLGNDNFSFCMKAAEEKWKTISISVGVKKEDYILVENLSGSFGHIGREDATRVDYITIDIAHGHCDEMRKMIKHIRSCFRHRFPDESPCPFIIAGNVTTPDAVKDLIKWGADAVKVGIGGGGACSTKNKTGFHIPMFTAVQQCVSAAWRPIPLGEGNTDSQAVPIIADGGVRENADIAKAMAAGAHMVMAGSIFAACEDSPAENVHKESTHYRFETGPKTYLGRITHKKYFGSASAKNKGIAKNVEGLEIEIPCNGMTYERKLKEIEEDLQSASSYAGGELRMLKMVEAILV